MRYTTRTNPLETAGYCIRFTCPLDMNIANETRHVLDSNRRRTAARQRPYLYSSRVDYINKYYTFFVILICTTCFAWSY
jgi:hypothetical protein